MRSRTIAAVIAALVASGVAPAAPALADAGARRPPPAALGVPSGAAMRPMRDNKTGETLVPAGSNYVGARSGRIYLPMGANGVIDTVTGKYIRTQ